LILSDATPPMLLALALTFLVMGIFAFAIMWPIGTVLLIAAIGVIVFCVQYSRVLRSLKEGPMTANARVISKNRKEYRSYEEVLYKCKIVVEFRLVKSLGIAEAIRLEAEVSGNIFDRYNEGDTVPILYSQADPRYSVLKGERQSWHSFFQK
ncbi:MAG: DUF3592 domain-containing protein, partial [Candidatus Thorarchaeota archaeon]